MADSLAEARPLQLYAGNDPLVGLTATVAVGIQAFEVSIQMQDQCLVAVFEPLLAVTADHARLLTVRRYLQPCDSATSMPGGWDILGDAQAKGPS